MKPRTIAIASCLLTGGAVYAEVSTFTLCFSFFVTGWCQAFWYATNLVEKGLKA